MSAEQQNKAWGQVVARACADAAFKRRLLADPAAVLEENGSLPCHHGLLVAVRVSYRFGILKKGGIGLLRPTTVVPSTTTFPARLRSRCQVAARVVACDT